MQKQVEKTRKFLVKQGFVLNEDLKKFERSNYLVAVANNLISKAAEIEVMLLDNPDQRLDRAHMLIEELGEVILGLANCDEVETLDGLSDLDFVVIGTALMYDLPLVEGLDEVCDSNLTKSPRKDGDPRCRIKGPDYVPPDMEQVLLRHRYIR